MTAEVLRIVTLLAEVVADRGALEDQHRRICGALAHQVWPHDDPWIPTDFASAPRPW